MRTAKPKLFLGQEGMTLLEVLIALVVLSMLMFGMIALTTSSQEIPDRVISEDREALKIETAMARLEWDFSQIYSPLFFSHEMNPDGMTPDEGEIYNQIIDSYQNNSRFSLVSYDGIPIPLFQAPDKSTIIFFTSSNRRRLEDVKQSNFTWIKYSLENDDEQDAVEELSEPAPADTPKGTYKLTRQVMPDDVYRNEDIDWSKVKTQVLMRKVKKLVFEFWNPDTFKWTENISLIKHGVNIIYALKVTIEYFDHDNVEVSSVRIFRPLFPEFKPENMYKYLNAKGKRKSGTSRLSTNPNPTTPEDETGQDP